MAFHLAADQYGAPSQHDGPMYSHMEPETITRDSDDSSVGSTSTPNSRRRAGFERPGGVVKRAISSPNVRGLGVDSIEMTAAEKKRNKLGYHRTAVACGHCRRRKIRCIPAFEDTSGRCQNCIRLKKECHFFPVDQQTLPAGRRPRTVSKADASLVEGEMSGTTTDQGVPAILKSSPEEAVRYNGGGLVPNPLSPRELAGFPSYDYSQAPAQPAVNQTYGQRAPAPVPPLHVNADVASSRHAYFPATASQVMASPLHTSPQSSMYPGQPLAVSSEPQWSHPASTASGSTIESEETYNPYGAYRTQSYPSNFRRASEPQHVPFGYRDSSGYPMNPVVRQSYEPSAVYAAGDYSARMPGSISQLPASSNVSYPSAWYPNTGGLPYLREEDGHPHLYGRRQP